MLTPKELMDAAELLIAGRFPGETVYRNLTPSGFVRPSWLLELGNVEMTDASFWCVEVKAVLKVTSFVKVDEYHHSHIDSLQERMMAVLELFAVEGLRCGDRVIHLAGSTGTCEYDYAQAIVTLRYQDDRPGTKDVTPQAEHVDVKVKENSKS